MRRSTRKPRLNHDENRWTKSLSITARSSRMIHGVEQLLAHAHERRGAAGREIEPAEQFQPPRLAGVVQFGRGLRRTATAARPRWPRRYGHGRGRTWSRAPRRKRCAARSSAPRSAPGFPAPARRRRLRRGRTSSASQSSTRPAERSCAGSRRSRLIRARLRSAMLCSISLKNEVFTAHPSPRRQDLANDRRSAMTSFANCPQAVDTSGQTGLALSD